ncbi:MAG TPA: copper chaperone PCu(A)C [Streptosporangiaceae bacterium]
MTATPMTGVAVIVLILATGCGGSGTVGHKGSTPAASVAEPPRAARAASRGNLVIMQPYLPRPPVTDVAALYFTVRNTGPGTDHLDRVEVPGLSSDVTMHTVRNHAMVRVRGYRVPPHGTLVLRRGGNHVMLTGLKQMPKPGGAVPARLFFRHAGEIAVDIPVVSQTYVPTSP